MPGWQLGLSSRHPCISEHFIMDHDATWGLFVPLLALACAFTAGLSACAPTQTAQVSQTATQTVQGLCKIDQLYQPVAVQVAAEALPVVAASGPTGTAVAAETGAALAVDEAAIHPLIVQACQAVGGQAVASAPATVPAAAPPSP
jgi:hypothetical protein